MVSTESTEYIKREQIVSERIQEATRDAELIRDKQRLDTERSDEELGSLSYWRTLAEILSKMEGEIDFKQRSDDAQHIFAELNIKGQVKRTEVEGFYNSWNDFLNLRASEEEKRLADVAVGVYDKKNED